MRKEGFSISSLAKEVEKSDSERLMWKNGFQCNRKGYFGYAKMIFKKTKKLINKSPNAKLTSLPPADFDDKPDYGRRVRLNDGLCDLLPCAHCGQPAYLHQQKSNDEEGGWFVECGNPACFMTTPIKFLCKDDASQSLAEIWNRRTTSPNVKLSRRGTADAESKTAVEPRSA